MTDIYAPPTSDIVPESKSDTTYGSIEKALNGEYHLETKAVLREAWEKTKGVKGSLWAAYVIIGTFTISLNLGLEFLLPIIDAGDQMVLSLILSMVPSIISGIVITPLYLGTFMIAIYRLSDRPYSYKFIFQYLYQYKVLIIASFLTTILIYLGFALLILPGIYLYVGYLFTWPLIGDRQFGYWQAMEISRKAITQHWFKVFGIFSIIGIIALISAIPLGIGLIWSLPFISMVWAVLYRDIFGIQGGQLRENERVVSSEQTKDTSSQETKIEETDGISSQEAKTI